MNTPTKPAPPAEATKEESPILGAAGFSMSLNLVNEKGGMVSAAFARARSGDWQAAAEDAGRFIAYMISKGWRLETHLVQEAQEQPAEPTKRPTNPTPANGEGGYVDVSQIKIKPEDESKTVLEFWKPGRQYAEERTTCNHARVIELLSGLGHEINPAMAKTLSGDYRVFWKKGREKPGKPGQFYHDIVTVEKF